VIVLLNFFIKFLNLTYMLGFNENIVIDESRTTG
jgi:hypothetical protein